jgi:uncharacterized membrane protein
VSASRAEGKREAYVRIAIWPVVAALLVIGVIYAVLPDTLRVGPPWLLLVFNVSAIAVFAINRVRGRPPLHPALGRVVALVVTAAVIVSVVGLLTGLPGSRTPAPTLLRDAALLWVTNVLTFALWYWELDGGGPGRRHGHPYRSTDFVFPQLVGEDESVDWWPTFFDYLFFAFNTSTAFSPTDTLILSRRAKAIMMCQSLISLTLIGVLIARAINTL